MLQCHTLLEDGHIMEACFFCLNLFAGCNSQNIVKQFLSQLILTLIFYHTSGIKVNPVILMTGQF